MWDERFSKYEFVYGEEPNAFIRECLEKIETGKAIFPAEGEGRNAVFAATLGWNCTAYDTSIEGRSKALNWAQKLNQTLDYVLEGHESFQSEANYFDALILCFSHVPGPMRKPLHEKLWKMVKPGGHLILVGFAKEQLGLNSGGPKDLAMLFEQKEVQSDFASTEWIEAHSGEEVLDEGPFHQGKAYTVRLFGKKK